MTTTEGRHMVAQRPLSGLSTANLDTEIEQGIRDLEILAHIYEQRGNREQAAEIRRAIIQIRTEIAARHAPELRRDRHD